MKSEDIKEPTKIVIENATVAVVKDKKKIVLSFENTQKKLVLNKTNAMELVVKFGADYQRWSGQEITIAAVPATFEGKTVKGIRVL